MSSSLVSCLTRPTTTARALSSFTPLWCSIQGDQQQGTRIARRTYFRNRGSGGRGSNSSSSNHVASLETHAEHLTTAATAAKDHPSYNQHQYPATTATHFSTQAELMHNLGISPNGQVRPSKRHDHRGTNGALLANVRRRRAKVPPRRSTEHPRTLYPLKAMHIAQTIDLDQVRHDILSHNAEKRKLFGKNALVVELETPTQTSPPQFVAVFRFGSVVFLNVPDKEAADLTEQIRKVSNDIIVSGNERREHFGIMVQPNGLYPPASQLQAHYAALAQPPPEHVVTGDYCIVSEIDLNGVAVISNILAQTVALDSYNDMVDRLLSQFATINAAVRATGHFKKSDKNFLFRTVAQNNAIFIDMISKIRLKDRSDTAWTMTKYETIHYGLKAEFEIDDRFDQIEFKLNLIQQNAKFFLEVMQHQKSNSLEWIIVWLIALESVLMCIDMSGKGEVFFQYLGLL